MLSEIKTALAIIAALVTVTSCTVAKRIDADRDKIRAELKVTKAERDGYIKALKQSEQYRAEEGRRAASDLDAAHSACNASLEAVRASERARRKIHDRPVPMKAGCPQRELVSARAMGLAP